MKKFEVIFTRCGVATVYANSDSEAMKIADETITSEDVIWDEDWPCTEVQEIEEED